MPRSHAAMTDGFSRLADSTGKPRLGYGSRSCWGMRSPRVICVFHLRIGHVSICGFGTFPTAGLHQPLLLHGAGRLKNNDIRGTQMHVRKSGGRQPAVGGQMRIGGQERRSSADRRRCACAWMAVAIAFIGATGGLRPPLLCWSANVCRRNNDFCDAQTHVRKNGGRQPTVVGEVHDYGGKCDFWRQADTPENGGCQRTVANVSNPQMQYAYFARPPSWRPRAAALSDRSSVLLKCS